MLKVFKRIFDRKRCASEKIEVAACSRLEKKDVERLFARVFLSEDGQKVLSYLQATTFQRALGSDSTDAQLRFIEGQRALLVNIQRLVNGGRV